MEIIRINGNDYYTVKDFALLTKRSEQSVRFLIRKGNRIRKLKADYIAGKPLVLCSELFDFPFTCAGRHGEIYHMTEEIINA